MLFIYNSRPNEKIINIYSNKHKKFWSKTKLAHFVIKMDWEDFETKVYKTPVFHVIRSQNELIWLSIQKVNRSSSPDLRLKWNHMNSKQIFMSRTTITASRSKCIHRTVKYLINHFWKIPRTFLNDQEGCQIWRTIPGFPGW